MVSADERREVIAEAEQQLESLMNSNPGDPRIAKAIGALDAEIKRLKLDHGNKLAADDDTRLQDARKELRKLSSQHEKAKSNLVDALNAAGTALAELNKLRLAIPRADDQAAEIANDIARSNGSETHQRASRKVVYGGLPRTLPGALDGLATIFFERYIQLALRADRVVQLTAEEYFDG